MSNISVQEASLVLQNEFKGNDDFYNALVASIDGALRQSGDTYLLVVPFEPQSETDSRFRRIAINIANTLIGIDTDDE